MVEIDIDFDYCGEVEMILAHDERGEHEDVEFYRGDLLAPENVKLQELVRDMFGAYRGAVEMLPSSYSKNAMKMAVMDIYDRMRELGIEVDG